MFVCPFLGLDDDSTIVLSETSPAHCCYALHPPAYPPEDYQVRFCLNSAYVECRKYTAAKPIKDGHRIVDPGASIPQRHRGRRAISWAAGAGAVIALVFTLLGCLCS